jgi:hypothetical protein
VGLSANHARMPSKQQPKTRVGMVAWERPLILLARSGNCVDSGPATFNRRPRSAKLTAFLPLSPQFFLYLACRASLCKPHTLFK